MTDAQREVLETFVMSSQHKLLNELQERQLDAIDAALKEIDRLTGRERVGLTEIDRLREAIHLALANKDQTHLGTVRSILADAVNAPKGTP